MPTPQHRPILCDWTCYEARQDRKYRDPRVSRGNGEVLGRVAGPPRKARDKLLYARPTFLRTGERQETLSNRRNRIELQKNRRFRDRLFVHGAPAFYRRRLGKFDSPTLGQ
jgi:hypothetical protein